MARMYAPTQDYLVVSRVRVAPADDRAPFEATVKAVGPLLRDVADIVVGTTVVFNTFQRLGTDDEFELLLVKANEVIAVVEDEQ